MTPQREALHQLLRTLGSPDYSYNEKPDRIAGARSMAIWLLSCDDYDAIRDDCDKIYSAALGLKYDIELLNFREMIN